MTELVKRSTGEVDPEEARKFSRSKLIPEHLANDAASAELMMRIGASLGIDPIGAFQHIYVFPDGKGRLKAGMSAHLMHALTLAAGHALHIEGEALWAQATLIRKTSDEDLTRFRTMREEERRSKLALLEDMQNLYGIQRRQILDRIADLKELAALEEKAAEDEVAELRKMLSDLHGQYDFEALRQKVSTTKFDLEKLIRFESRWTMKRANSIEGLTSKSTWQNYGPEMLKNRAKSGVVRDGGIDVILGVRSILSQHGVMFSGDTDDDIALSSVLYTPEELGADTDGEGRPIINGEVINPTDEKRNAQLEKLMNAARGVVEKSDPDKIAAWASNQATREDVSPQNKISRIQAVLSAARSMGKAVEKLDGDSTLDGYLETLISSLRN